MNSLFAPGSACQAQRLPPSPPTGHLRIPEMRCEEESQRAEHAIVSVCTQEKVNGGLVQGRPFVNGTLGTLACLGRYHSMYGACLREAGFRGR